MFDAILMPVDLSDPSSWEATLPAAARLLNPGGTLHVLTVVPDLSVGVVESVFPEDYEERAMHAAGQRLEELAAGFDAGGATVRPHVVHGGVAHEIMAAAEKTGAGAIVMSSHRPRTGVGGVADWLLGANALRVVQRAPVSVFVIRPAAR